MAEPAAVTPEDEIFPLRGARVYVAGHLGMVGSACVRRLQAEGCDILVADRAKVDLRRQAQVEAFMQEARPDAVIVAAGSAGLKVRFGCMPAAMATTIVSPTAREMPRI